MTKKLAIALGAAASIGAAVLTAQTMQINGAGATFPYPIYSKWFSDTTSCTRTSRSITSRSARAAASSR